MAIIGELSIVTTDGTELHANNDVTLAWLWAEHEVTLQNFGGWEGLRYNEKCLQVADAPAELRRAYDQS